MLRNYEINRLVGDLELPLRPGGRHVARAGTARRCTRSSTRCEFRVLRDRLYEYLDAVEPEAESGFDLAGERARAPAQVGRLARPSTPAGAPVGVAVAGTFGRGTGALTGVAVATADGPAAWFDPAALDAGRRGGGGRPGWPTRTGPR